MLIMRRFELFSLNGLCFRFFFAVCIHQPNPPGKQLLHHALLNLLILGKLLFQLLNFTIHIRKDLGNGLLLFYQRGVFQN